MIKALSKFHSLFFRDSPINGRLYFFNGSFTAPMNERCYIKFFTRVLQNGEIADEIFRLRELRQKTTVDTAARDEQIKRINDLQDYISQQTALLTEFDEALVRRWIKQITIWDDRITVELKSGVSIDVDA